MTESAPTPSDPEGADQPPPDDSPETGDGDTVAAAGEAGETGETGPRTSRTRVVAPPRGGASVPPAPPDATQKVVRRRRGRDVVDGPSLSSPLLSGRSLAPQKKVSRWEFAREHRSIVAVVGFLVLVALVIGLGKLVAERTADTATADRAAQIEQLLDGATPDEFLAFNAGVKTRGSLAEQVRDEPGFVNVKAVADLSFIRFQPSGWWAGFTERCIVAEVRPDGVRVTVPKTACIRVEEPPS
jgi:hypothetical protein